MLYIAFLRGINVGGRLAKMQHLRELFSELGLAKVRSYIQTGNIFFEAPDEDRFKLQTRIEEHLAKALGYDVPVFLRTIDELEAVVAHNPFEKIEVTADMRCCVMFLDSPAKSMPLPLFSDKKDLQILDTRGTEAYVIWHIINGRPPSSPTFLEQHLGVRNTTRFYHTLVKILEAAKN